MLSSRHASPDSVLGDAPIIVIVDPISTGAHLAHHVVSQGQRAVRVWSDCCPDAVKNHTQAGLKTDFVATLQFDANDVDATVRAIKEVSSSVADVMVGCETGVLCCDILAAALGARGNGIELSSARRNKAEQAARVRSAGLDAPIATLAHSSADVEAFLSSHEFPTPFKAVVKPVEGAGSDGVSICNTPEEVREAYAALEGTKNVLGLSNYAVLLQEYLRGDEYVVDTVSSDGVHKCVAIWKYDKRELNGAPVVYYGMQLLGVDAEPALRGMVEYVTSVLDSIGIQFGAMHTEVKLEERGPVLVEVNARLHGGEGIWLPISSACLGYTQVSAMYDAYRVKERYDALPRVPDAMRAHGAWVTIRSHATGEIREMHDERILALRGLASYLNEYLPPTLAPGHPIVQTIDACTVHGCFNLVHADPQQLAADYEAAQAIIDAGLFSVA